MRKDRIIEPERVAGLIREHLEGKLDGITVSYEALRLAGLGDRILAGHRTRVVTAAYWELRRLAETGRGRPDEERLRFLLDCLEGRRRFPPLD